MAYLLAGSQALLLAVFAVSGVGKVRGSAAWSAFVQSVRDLRLLPSWAVRPAAAATVAGELAVVLLLAGSVTVLAGMGLAAGMLTVFTAAIVVTTRRGLRAACQCFGRAATQPLGMRHVVRNGLLLAVAVAGGVAGWATASGPVPSWAGVHPAGLVIAVAAGLTAAAVIIFFDEIVELFAGPAVGAARPQ